MKKTAQQKRRDAAAKLHNKSILRYRMAHGKVSRLLIQLFEAMKIHEVRLAEYRKTAKKLSSFDR